MSSLEKFFLTFTEQEAQLSIFAPNPYSKWQAQPAEQISHRTKWKFPKFNLIFYNTLLIMSCICPPLVPVRNSPYEFLFLLTLNR